jgi:hypothetical protein
MPEIELFQAFQTQNWYAVAALLMFGLLALLKANPFGRVIWDWLDQHNAKAAVPVALAFATGFTEAYTAGVEWPVAILRGVSAIIFVALPAMGVHSALKDSALPYGGTPNNLEK